MLMAKLRAKLGDESKIKDISSIYNSFDVIGDIAVIKLPFPSNEKAKIVAESIMESNKGVRTVLLQKSKILGEHRLRKLGYIAGIKKTFATYKEHNCTFKVNLETCYFSPRLSGERLRISKLIQPKETIINMFAGVGSFSILIAKQMPSAKIYSIDINPEAIKFMEQNIKVNRVYGKVIPLFGDSKGIILNQLQNSANRVLMPLPEKAIDYLPFAFFSLKNQ
jgi:tRNA (guanine37-N1)-methyltransferase